MKWIRARAFDAHGTLDAEMRQTVVVRVAGQNGVAARRQSAQEQQAQAPAKEVQAAAFGTVDRTSASWPFSERIVSPKAAAAVDFRVCGGSHHNDPGPGLGTALHTTCVVFINICRVSLCVSRIATIVRNTVITFNICMSASASDFIAPTIPVSLLPDACY